MMHLFKMRTLEHTFRQDPAASKQQDISVTETKEGLALCIERADGNYNNPINFGHTREYFLHFSTDTKQTHILHYVNIREAKRKRKDPFSRVHRRVRLCQNSATLPPCPSEESHIQFIFGNSDSQKQNWRISSWLR